MFFKIINIIPLTIHSEEVESKPVILKEINSNFPIYNSIHISC
jgi:hypothetical protein